MNPYCLPDSLLEQLLHEDSPYGDATSFALGLGAHQGELHFAARQAMTLCASEDAQRMAQMLGLRAAAAVLPGCDEAHLLAAPEPPGFWTAAQRAALGLPSREDLERVQRAAWAQALSAAPKGDAAEALLRLEIAAEVPTPAEHIAARRMLQLQLLTRRNDPSPAQTWGDDTARVLSSASDAGSARRLQNVLKTLLRK